MTDEEAGKEHSLRTWAEFHGLKELNGEVLTKILILLTKNEKQSFKNGADYGERKGFKAAKTITSCEENEAVSHLIEGLKYKYETFEDWKEEEK